MLKHYTGLPAKLRIGPFVYQIKIASTELSARGIAAECNNINSVLSFRDDLPKGRLIECVFHEIFHAFYYIYTFHDEDKEERIASMIGTAMSSLYQDNPALTKWLFEISKLPA